MGGSGISELDHAEEFELQGRFAWTSRAQNRLSHWTGGLIGIGEGMVVADIGAGIKVKFIAWGLRPILGTPQ